MTGKRGLRLSLRIGLAALLSFALLAPVGAEAKTKRSRSARGVQKSIPLAPFTTVVIDAGHGGADPGGIRQNLIPEKHVALDVAKRLQANLKRAGLKTIMTRTDDRFIPLDQRVAIANSYRDAIFMCIHFNSAARRGARGVETYFAAPAEATLAARIQRNLAATTTGENRGVKRASFRVLRNTRMRAVLAECGFLTNPVDAALANNSRYRETLAKQMAAAIVEERNALRRLQANASRGAALASLRSR